MQKKKIWVSFQRIIELFTQKFSPSSKKIMGLGSGILDPEKPYTGSRIRVQGLKRHRIPDLDPQHCLQPSRRNLLNWKLGTKWSDFVGTPIFLQWSSYSDLHQFYADPNPGFLQIADSNPNYELFFGKEKTHYSQVSASSEAREWTGSHTTIPGYQGYRKRG